MAASNAGAASTHAPQTPSQGNGWAQRRQQGPSRGNAASQGVQTSPAAAPPQSAQSPSSAAAIPAAQFLSSCPVNTPQRFDISPKFTKYQVLTKEACLDTVITLQRRPAVDPALAALREQALALFDLPFNA